MTTRKPRTAVAIPPTPAVPAVRTASEIELLGADGGPDARVRARRPPALVNKVDAQERKYPAPAPGTDPKLLEAQLAAATGTHHSEAMNAIYAQVALICGSYDPASQVTGALAHMLDLAPTDGVEGMLAAQMACTHTVAMDLLHKGVEAGTIERRDHHLKHAERLMRLYGLQLDALTRYRSKGSSEQKVTVTHVHVNQGGQAVVGNVTTGGGGTPADA